MCISFELGVENRRQFFKKLTPILKSTYCTHLKPTAVDDDIYAVAEALASLQVPTIEEVLKVETSGLIPGV